MSLRIAPNVAMIGDRMVNELSAVVSELGGHLAIGRDVHSDEDMSAAIREGFPHSAVEGLLKSSGFSCRRLLRRLTSPCGACKDARVRGGLHATSPTASTGLPVWSPLPATF